jgi:hypothetical protein
VRHADDRVAGGVNEQRPRRAGTAPIKRPAEPAGVRLSNVWENRREAGDFQYELGLAGCPDREQPARK